MNRCINVFFFWFLLSFFCLLQEIYLMVELFHINLLNLLWIPGGSNPIKGDILVIVGSMLYAVANVSEVRYYAS